MKKDNKVVKKVFKKFKKDFKLLQVVAEKEAQFFTTNTTTVSPPAVELLDPVVSVTFDRAVLLQNKAIVQGAINKNIIYKGPGGQVLHQPESISFSKEVELPGLNPHFTIGKFNRLTLNNDVVEIGPDNHGNQGGIDVQIFVTRLVVKEFLLDNNNNNKKGNSSYVNLETAPPSNGSTIEQKIVLDFIVKVSKFTQVDMEVPAPSPVFECRNVVKCKNNW